MIRDSGGNKMSPRQKAAEVMLLRLGSHSSLDLAQSADMTDREIALVNKQLEKLHNKIVRALHKARKEERDDE